MAETVMTATSCRLKKPVDSSMTGPGQMSHAPNCHSFMQLPYRAFLTVPNFRIFLYTRKKNGNTIYSQLILEQRYLFCRKQGMSEISKLKNVLQADGLFRLSSCGIGLAAMFPPFYERLELPGIWLSRIDFALALSVVIFMICLSYHVGWMYENYKGRELSEIKDLAPSERKELELIERRYNTKFAKIAGVFVISCIGIGGIYYIGLAFRSPCISSTSTVLGYALFGVSLIFWKKILTQFFPKPWIG